MQLVVQPQARDALARGDPPRAAQMAAHTFDAAPKCGEVGLLRFVANAAAQRQPLRRGTCVTGKRFYKGRQLILRDKRDGEA
ncbi:hypothetical protein PanNE5_27000 [Pandoraea sp. NE5]|nr:hypothetical protein PanNE5_27000 [Pandoraea sp. NE5]